MLNEKFDPFVAEWTSFVKNPNHNLVEKCLKLGEILYESYGEGVEFLPEFLDDITPEQILIRMARNLKNSYVQSYAYDMAMRCIDMALALEPDSPEEIRDKGILEERLLHYEKALEFLNKYLEINPNAEDVDFILELIKSIREKN